jgi:phenylpropionate dioxygenase-like ring-hydroxylating dioxygenase large terminal subunit
MAANNEGEFDYRVGYVVYPDGTSGEAGAKAPYVDHGTALIDPARYYSKEEADLEWDRMWTRVWTFAGVTHDLAKVGDYFTYDLGRESFIVVRDAPGSLKAYYNVCPHRGNRLVYNELGNIADGGAFYCNFHGWRFNLDGSIHEVKDRHTFREEVVCDLKGLKEVRCEVWNTLVFINMDPRAMPLLQYLDVIPQQLEGYDFSLTRVHGDLRGTIDANWKIALEAFIEFYHADDTHPQALPISATLKTQYDLYANGMSRMIIPLGYSGDRAKNPEEVNDVLKGFIAFFGGDNDDYKHLKGNEYRAAYADTMRKWGDRNGYKAMFDKLTDDQLSDDWNYHVFPTITINVFCYGLLVQSWTPHPTDPEKHVYRALSLLMPVQDPEQYVMDPTSFATPATKGWKGEERPPVTYPQAIEEWGNLLVQDIERVPMVQRGIRSRSYEGHRLSESECRLRHYLAEIDRWIGRV